MSTDQHAKTDILVAITLLFLGFYGGIGFFTIIGLNPALLKMSEPGFVEFWQHVDSYMGSRMSIIGPLILLLTLASTILLHKRYSRKAAIFMTIALLLIIIDAAFALNLNDPLNTLIQSWDLNSLPADVSSVQHRVVNIFWFRSTNMIMSFILGILAFWKRTPATQALHNHRL